VPARVARQKLFNDDQVADLDIEMLETTLTRRVDKTGKLLNAKQRIFIQIFFRIYHALK
jgi:hypothetical protein